jgi:ATP:ADP antiporter, AAA family
MKRWIERILNIQSGDLGRGTLLCSSLFLILSSYMTGRVARDALFLSRFKAVQLPYADIACALLVATVIAGYLRIARRVSLRNLLVGSQLFFAANCALFWILARYYHLVWLVPVFYVWVGIFGVLAPTQIWTLANYVLTTREAKRIFGMVGGGAIAGAIFAGFLSKTMAKAFGTESLLLVMALLILICPLLVIQIWRSGQAELGESNEEVKQASAEAPGNLRDSVRLVFSSSYLTAIAAVIWLASFVTTFTGWQFKAIAKQFLGKQDALAIFFGDFTFYIGVLALIFQFFFTARCLRKFGISTTLLVLPVAVFIGSMGLLLWGTLAAAVFLKGCDQVLRYSLDKSTAELLYLPLPGRLKLQVKWLIDTVIWRLGDGFAGLTVLIFATYLHLAARQMSWISLVLVSGWIAAVLVVRKQYVVTLKESISKHCLDSSQASAPVLDRSTASLIASKLSAADPKDILYALGLFEVERQRAAHPAVRGLLKHSAPEVRQKALAILSGAADKTVLPEVQELLKDPEPSVRTEALLYLTHHGNVDPLTVIEELGDFADFSLRSAMVAYLARPGEAQNLETARKILDAMASETGAESVRNRVEAARLLGVLPDCFDPLLSGLLSDKDKSVAQQAIHSVGCLRKRRLVPQVLDYLADPHLATECSKALANFQDGIVGALRDYLGDDQIAVEVRREIPGILVSIGTPAAGRVLQENLLQSDTALRFRIICALNKMHRLHPEIEPDRQMLETVLAAEILGHYRSYQILSMLGPGAQSEDPVVRALKESMDQELERIFRLMGLLYPHLDVHTAYIGLQSKNVSVYDNALEFLENILKSPLREMLVPLLDGRVTVVERARIANRLVRTKIESQEEAVAALVCSEDSWLRSCGAYAIGALGIKSLEEQLNRCLSDADPLLRETARTAKLRLQQLAAKA